MTGRPPLDLTGQRFGRLVAVSDTGRRTGNNAVWLCRCDCGGEHEAQANHLRRGVVGSCGCSRRRDISGQRFGRLVALRPTGDRRSAGPVWLCRCDCGREHETVADYLVAGTTRSCGCLRREVASEQMRSLRARGVSASDAAGAAPVGAPAGSTMTSASSVARRARAGSAVRSGLASVKAQSRRGSSVESSTREERMAILEWDTEVAYVPVQWLWRDWLVRGNLNVLAGDGGVGKTHFAVGLAARLSRGDLPGDHRGVSGKTLYLSAEDDFASHLKKLYRAAEGVPGRFARMKISAGDWLDDPVFPEDLPAMRRLVREDDISLVVIDPGAAFFTVKDSHNDQQMRSRVFGPLASLAMGEGVTILYVAHLTKGGGTFRQRINGAVGLSNAPRSVIGMTRDPQHADRSIVAHVKGNLAKPPASIVLEFVEAEAQVDGQAARATTLRRVGTSHLSADELVAPGERETKADQAAAFLRDALADGPMPSSQLNQHAADSGFSTGTLAEAKRREQAVSRRDGRGWMVGYPHQFADE